MTVSLRFDAVTLPDGTRVAVLGLDIPETAPPLVREGLARRAIVNSGDPCPCGARAPWPNRAERRAARKHGRALHLTVHHENDCPAIDPAVPAWAATHTRRTP